MRDGVEVQLLRHLEGLRGNGNPADVNLDPKARIGGNALGGFTQSAADEIPSAGDNPRLGEAPRHGGLQVWAEVFAHNVFVLRQVRLLGRRPGGSALECGFLPFQHVQSHVGRAQVAAEHQKVLRLSIFPFLSDVLSGGAPGRDAHHHSGRRGDKVEAQMPRTVLLGSGGDTFPEILHVLDREAVGQGHRDIHSYGSAHAGVELPDDVQGQLVPEMPQRIVRQVEIHLFHEYLVNRAEIPVAGERAAPLIYPAAAFKKPRQKGLFAYRRYFRSHIIKIESQRYIFF